jgi:hypothetical protein
MLMLFYINVPAFVLICYWDQLDLFSICTFIVVAWSSAPVLFSSALIMSGIYNISSQFQRSLKQKIQACDNKAIKKVWLKELRSCQVVRCEVGNFYHMEGKAKLTLVDAMVNVFVFMVVQRKLQ